MIEASQPEGHCAGCRQSCKIRQLAAHRPKLCKTQSMHNKQRLTPTKERASVAAGFVTGMLAALPARQIELPPLLAGAGVTEQVLHDPAQRIPVSQYAALYNLVVHALDDEGFALFAQPLRTGSFEFLCRAVLSASTLAEALERASRFLSLLLPEFKISLQNERGIARLQIRANPSNNNCGFFAQGDAQAPGRLFAFEWLLRLLHALSCWLVGRGLQLDTVSFPYARPAHADDYALIYTAHSYFTQESVPQSARAALAQTLTACFASNLLDLPIRKDESMLANFLDGAPGKIALLYRRDRETVLRVRDLIRAALPELPSLATVAKQLNLSERTLHRRLEEEGSQFRAIREAIRRDMALARLSKTTQPLSKIATDLGYSEASAFYRAVISWTGDSPSLYRQRAKR